MPALETVKSGATAIPSSRELVERAQALIPMLKEKADQVEKDRKVSSETIQAFVDAGFFKILQPPRWGGYGMNPIVFFRVLNELGRGCPASAWNMMILGVHQWEFGVMNAQAGEDVWGQDDTVIVASSYPPVGKLTKVEGGYRLSGRYPTSSGTDHGKWAFVGALERNEEGVPVNRIALLVSHDDYDVIDDWHVFGLAGTGSKSLMVNDAFIPDHRTHSMIEYHPNKEFGPSYAIPFMTVFYSAVSAVIIGFAQGAIDVYIEHMKVRKNTGTGDAAALSPYVKDRLGNAVGLVRSCKARMEFMMAEVMEKLENGERISKEERAHYLLDTARVGRECEEAVMLLFKPMGARGIYLSNPMQRFLRDTIAGANHITQNADDTAGLVGGYLLGQELPDLMFGKD
ncbi:acyl-CoA dehydrogenase family protein [Hyphomonas adhaerens]|nr:acyl-CoA dehydrogenase family protein [Hyphomonas adhaerens]